MSRPNAWGSRANRERRKEVADKNAQKPQINCLACGTRHREGRCFMSDALNLAPTA